MASGVSKKELDVDELKVTSAVLMGAAHHYGTHCQKVNEEFMECRVASKDPRCCLEEGKQVTRWVVNTLQHLTMIVLIALHSHASLITGIDPPPQVCCGFLQEGEGQLQRGVHGTLVVSGLPQPGVPLLPLNTEALGLLHG